MEHAGSGQFCQSPCSSAVFVHRFHSLRQEPVDIANFRNFLGLGRVLLPTPLMKEIVHPEESATHSLPGGSKIAFGDFFQII